MQLWWHLSWDHVRSIAYYQIPSPTFALVTRIKIAALYRWKETNEHCADHEMTLTKSQKELVFLVLFAILM